MTEPTALSERGPQVVVTMRKRREAECPLFWFHNVYFRRIVHEHESKNGVCRLSLWI